MKKNQRLILFFVSLLTAGLATTSCDAPSKDIEIKEVEYISFLDVDADQGYYYDDGGGLKFQKLIPMMKPPFTLLVIPKSERSTTILKSLSSSSEAILNNIQEISSGMFLVTSSQYFESPLFYISNSYKTSENNPSYDIKILPTILVKMKDGKDISTIQQKYKDKLTINQDNNLKDVYKFDCSLGSSFEVLELANEIYLLDDVEWAEANKMGGYHTN